MIHLEHALQNMEETEMTSSLRNLIDNMNSVCTNTALVFNSVIIEEISVDNAIPVYVQGGGMNEIVLDEGVVPAEQLVLNDILMANNSDI
ncbi:hypothetical protein A0H81_09158 [Grifola frondosa]|uniref:Uncharacterized protein n=1 Tax=Grifola frondosa TaxID=5627 RepID=A0A1C7M248_GRIFR|nr:hypothetical protein A0H81_09158 [Grifola frondosa]